MGKLTSQVRRYRNWWLPVILVLAIVGITALLSLNNQVRTVVNSFDSSKSNYIYRLTSARTMVFGLFVSIGIGFLLYAWIDYKQHKLPLLAIDSTIHYGFLHHIRVVSLPLMRYKWKPLTYWSTVATMGMAALVVTTVLTGMFTHAFSGFGSGTPNDPYIVNTCTQLQEIQDNTAASYALGNDVDCSDTVSWNSGAGFVPISSYSGTFDGRGFSVNSLTMVRTVSVSDAGGGNSLSAAGFILYLNGGVIKNTHFNGGSITINTSYPTSIYIWSGAIAASSSGTIQNVSSSINMTGGTNIGGLVGSNYGTISRSSSTGNITGNGANIELLGGLVSRQWDYGGEMTMDSYATGNVTGSGVATVDFDSRVCGGLMGEAGHNDIVTRTYSSGTVDCHTNSDSASVGGLFGMGGGTGTSNNFSVSPVDTSGHTGISLQRTGGLIGEGSPDASSNYFDVTRTGQADCTGAMALQPCNGVNISNAQPDYFKDNHTNAPLTSWDFTTVWKTFDTGYPLLRDPPGVHTLGANKVKTTTAALNGTITTLGGSPLTTRGFEYGTSTSYGSTLTQGGPYFYNSQLGIVNTGSGVATPWEMAHDAADNIYVIVDTNTFPSKREVHVYNKAGDLIRTIGTIWDGNGSNDGKFASPFAVAVDASGNVYVSDFGFGSPNIQKFDSDGNFVTKWGGSGTGNGQFSSNSRVMLAIDSSNSIYATDSGATNTSPRIQKFDSDGNYLGQWGAYGVGDGEFLDEQLSLATDSANHVFVAQLQANRVQKFDSNGTYIGQWGSYGTGDSQFNVPWSIAVDASDNVFVGDADSLHAVVKKFDNNGIFITKWGSFGTLEGQLSTVSGLTVNNAGKVYVTDEGRVQIFEELGDYSLSASSLTCNTTYHYRAFASNGDGTGYGADQTFTTSTCPAVPTVTTQNSNGTTGTATTVHGDVTNVGSSPLIRHGFEYGADTSYGSSFSTTLIHNYSFATKWGSTGTGDGQFAQPTGVATDSAGNVFVTDNGNNRIQKFDSSGNYLSQIGPGYGDGALDGPFGVAIDSFDNIYVSNAGFSGHAIKKFDANGHYMVQWGNGVFGQYVKLAVSSDDEIYVSDESNNRVQKFNTDGTLLAQWGSAGTGDGQFDRPLGIGVDPAGNVYVSDTGNARIQKFDSTGTFVTKWGSAGLGESQFASARDLFVDQTGSVYVFDCGFNGGGCNPKIKKFNSTGTPLSQIGSTAGTGDGHFNYIPGAGIFGLAVDESGNLFAADGGNNRIQKFALQSQLGDYALGLSDLTCGTLYHYRATATNFDGTGYGADQTFTTAACPSSTPTVTTDGADPQTNTSETLRGTVLDIGEGSDAITYHGFEYGGTSGYGSTLSVPGSWYASPYDETISALTCNTTYHYRAFATNNLGFTGYGDDQSFTTSTCSVSYAQTDYSLTKTLATTGIIHAGDSVTYHFKITNEGVDTLMNGGMYDILPTEFTFASNTNNSVTCQDQGLADNAGGYFAGFYSGHHLMTCGTNSGTDIIAHGQSVEFDIIGTANADFVSGSTTNSGAYLDNYETAFQAELFAAVGANVDFTTLSSNNVSRVTYNTAQAPEPPRDLAGDPTTTSVALTWQPPASDGGSPIVNYLVQYRPHGSGTWQEFSHTASVATAYTIPGLNSGATYDFQVSALNNVGQSGWVLGIYDVKTNPAPVTPTNPVTPTTPTTPRTPTSTLPLPKDAESPAVVSTVPNSAVVVRVAAGAPVSPTARIVSTWLHTTANILPYILILILLLLALLYARQARREYLQRQSLLKLLARYQNTKQATDAYIAITTHYLNTPLAIMKSAIELLGSLKKLPEWSVASMQQNLNKLGDTIKELAAFQVADIQVPGVLPSEAVGGSSNPQVNPLKAKKIWGSLLGVAVGLATMDIAFTVTGAFNKPLVRLGVQALCFMLAGGLLMIAYRFRDAQVAFRQATTRLVTAEQKLLDQRQNFISTSALKLSDQYENLRTLTQSYGFIPETKSFFNGLRILGSVAASMSRVEMFTKMSSDVPNVPLSGAYTALLPRLNAIAAEHKVSLVNKLESATVVQAQHEELDQLLFSIIDNGIKFNHEGGTVTIAAQKLKNKVAITIRDTGVGIPKEKLDHLLEPFARGTSTETFDYEGLGLSMYTNKIIIEKLGGTMDIQSNKDGTKVTLELPSLSQSAAAPVMIAPQPLTSTGALVGTM